jgi:hypothetical protein
VDFLFTLPTMGHEEWIDAWNKRSEIVQEGLRGKLAAFYVGFANGKVSNPSALFTQEVAAETVALIDFVIRIQAQSFQGDLTRLVSPPAELRAVLSDMQQAKTAADRDVAAQALLKFADLGIGQVPRDRHAVTSAHEVELQAPIEPGV